MQRSQYDNVFRCIGQERKSLKPPTWSLAVESISENGLGHKEKYRATEVNGWFLFQYVNSSK